MSSVGGPGLIVILGAVLLAALIWPASAPAQGTAPPPVHSFDLEQPPNAAEGEADELILIDLYDFPDEGSSAQQSPLPSLPPGAAPAASTPPADPGPPAGAPLVNIPLVPTPTEERSLSAPLEPPAANPVERPPSVPTPAGTAQPVQTPTPTVSPAQVPAGYTPLPTVPLQPAPDPFAPPSTPEPEPEAMPVEQTAPVDSLTVPLGRTQSVPAPQWDLADPETTPSQSQVISGAPLPQFDSSQSPWIQLEIGQGDGSGQAPPAATRPTSVYSLPDPAAKTQAQPPKPGPVEVKVDAAVDQALDQAVSQPPAAAERPLSSPSGREHLRNLFFDMMPPEAEGARAPTVTQPTSGGPTPGPEKNVEDVGSSAILKAGELLTVDEQFGAAEILPPLSGRPRWPSAETPAPAKPAPVPETPAVSPKPDPQAVTPAPKAAPAASSLRPEIKSAPAPAKASGAGRSKKGPAKKTGRGAQTPTPAATPAGLSLIIINETGRERVGQQYRSVLNQMGYKVVSVGEGRPGQGTAGQTVINYRPGLKAKAQAVARHLPGKKVLVEARKGQVLASEIMIYIR